MSGPYCKDCDYYRPVLFTNETRGECSDPSKEIIDRNGNTAISAPEVDEMYSCDNHKQRTDSFSR